MERRIIHLNIADFCVAVERLLDTGLRGQPLIIAVPSPRAVVLDMSDEAYDDGVRKGMLLGTARHRCRRALVLPPRPEQYHKALRRCLEHALHYTPLVEPSTGAGHLFLDVTGTHRLFGPAPDIGWCLRNTLRRDLGLDPIWSVGANKLVAKVASRLVKPRGEYIVGGGEERSFLAPLPLHLLPELSPMDLLRLRQVNISRVHQAARLSVQELSVLCEHRAKQVYQVVRGIDVSPIQPSGTPGQAPALSHLFTPDTNQEPLVRAAILTLAQQAGQYLRQRQLGCRRISVTLHYTDGLAVPRQAVSPVPVLDDPALQHLALAALYRAWHRRVRLRRVELACALLRHPVEQLDLFAGLQTPDTDAQRTSVSAVIRHTSQQQRQLSSACDLIRARCGSDKILRGGQQPLGSPQPTP